MASFGKSLLAVFLLVSLGGCSSQSNQTEAPKPSPSKATTVAPSTSPSPNLADDIHRSPRAGGIRDYYAAEGKVNQSAEEWTSYLSLKGEIPINWPGVAKVTFIPVCNSESGKFILYKNGKNIGDGPCGPGQVNSFTLPKPESISKETFSFEIIGATKAEVAVCQEKVIK